MKTVVVHGHKQLTMYQEVEDGQPMFNISGEVALIRDSSSSRQSDFNANAVIQTMEHNGFTVTEKRLERDLDLSEFRYLIFVMDMPSMELGVYVQHLRTGSLKNKSFCLISGIDTFDTEKFKESVKHLLVEAGAEPMTTTDFGPKGTRGVPDSVLVEDVFRTRTDGNPYAHSPYVADKNKCREYLIYDTRAILPIFAVAYNRCNSAAEQDNSDVATLEDIIFSYLPPSRP